MMRPLLGISCCRRTGEREPVHGVIERYVTQAAQGTDADVLLVPALGELADWRSMAARLDGLLLTGSPSNVEPARYGATAGEGPFDPARDASNFGLLAAMLEAGKPVFGICRGLQELNVALGGSLRAMPQDLVAHHAPEGVPLDAMFAHDHPVWPQAGSDLAAEFGTAPIMVNSVHYQGIDRLAPALRAEALAQDGVVEAVSGRIGGAAVYAMQWHPEWQTEQRPVYQWFFTRLAREMREG
jgi:putative glutamine amidotransferase